MNTWLPITTSWMASARRLLPALPAHDLLRDLAYRRLWLSILISSFGGQVTMLALPLTAVLLLHASPTQMGLLTAMELLPFVLFSLPVGVWLDRVRKLPVYIAGELTIGVVVASVPLAWWAGWLSIEWLYVCGFVIGTVYTIAGSAAQIVLTQVVARDRLVGAPVALLVDAVMVTVSAAILRGVRVDEPRREPAVGGTAGRQFWLDLKQGVRFVARHRLLVALAIAVGCWQACHQAATVVQILFATRTLGLSEQAIGLCFTGMGVGTVLASVFGNRISRRIGPGPCLLLGFAVCGAGWLLLAVAPANAWGVAAFATMLMMFSTGAVFIFINFLALRQAVTPAPLLGRMTSTMRWLILIPAGPGALLGGWLGEHVGLRASLAVAGAGALLLAGIAWQFGSIRRVRELPAAEQVDEALGAEADVSGRVATT